MNTSQHKFSERVQGLNRKHVGMSKGVSTHVQPDGLIVMHPRRRRSGLPLRGIFMLIAVGIAFKTLLVIQLGQITFQGRVDQMMNGSVVEKFGAWFMQLDPVTLWLSEFILYYIG
jgi:hypothetical protein